MQFRIIIRVLGILLCGEAIMMAPSLIVALIYGDGDSVAFLLSMGILVALGLPPALMVRHGKRQFFSRDGFALVGISWLLLSIFGALPFVFSSVAPNYIDALFEAASGFTTTGASILTHVEGYPRGVLFWRSFTHWVGGMGVLVLTIAVLPQVGARNMEILRAESTGPSPGKLMPRLRDTAKILYLIYIFLSAVMLAALLLTGMPLYDSLVNMFGTAGTGGFSVRNASIGAYGSLWVDIIIGVFMALFGVNFSVFFTILIRRSLKALRNEELWLYGGIIAASVLLIALDIEKVYGSVWEALRHAFFQVSSIITTTGFATADFNQWPTLSRTVLVLLMFLGACAGSTGGGIKVSRLLLLLKAFRREISLILHPRIVRPMQVDGKTIEENTMRSVLAFFFIYMLVGAISILIVSLDGFDLVTTSSAVISSIGNVGPGLGLVGPMGNFSAFSPLSKLTLCLCMLLGRLEIMPILLLFSPSLWRRA